MTTIEKAGTEGFAVLTETELAQKFTHEELRKYVAEAQQVAAQGTYNINERRFASEETRFNIWDGQSPDGRKHADAQDGTPAFPFEGASDTRIRLADQIVNERVLILVAAALRNMPRIKGMELRNEGLGHKLTTLLKWVLRNKIGSEYLKTIIRIAQWQEGDSPAGAMLGVWWEQEEALEMKDLTIQDLQKVVLQLIMGGGQTPFGTNAPGQTSFGINSPGGPGDGAQGGMGGAMPGNSQMMLQQQFGRVWAQLETQLLNPARDGESAKMLQELLPHLKDKRARQVVRDLREAGTAEYPSPYLRRDEPALCAYRLYEDIFFPTNTAGDVQNARCYFIREWLNEVQLRQRIVSDDYDPAFVDDVLEQEGMSGWPMYRRNPTQGDFMVIKQEESKEAYRGLYEVNTVVFRAVNEDDVAGVYYFPFSFHVEEPAHDRKLLEYSHGKYPVVYFQREILGQRLLDTRGVPELASTDQSTLKLLADSFNDNVQLATVPPIKVPRRRTKLSLVIGPLKVIKEDRPGDVSWMEPPVYPIGNEKQQQLIKARVDEYFGRISEHVPPLLSQLHQSGMVQLFLATLTDALVQVLQLCQQYMSDEELAMITGDDGIPIAHSRDEIQGKFNVELSFDPRDLDMEYLKELVGMMVQVLQMDTLNTVQRDKLVQRIFTAIDPSLANETLRPVTDASESEVKDESVNFARIAAGDEPEMVAEGQNFPLRLQVLQSILQKNPEAGKNLSDVSKTILEARMKYLENQVQQQRNAQIGRQVGQPALQTASGPTAPGGPGAPMPGIGGQMGQQPG